MKTILRLSTCVVGLIAAAEAVAYPNCDNDPSVSAVFIAGRMANGEELDKLYDYYFVRALQRKMAREAFTDVSRSIHPDAVPGSTRQPRRPMLMKPVMQEVDQAAVRQFTRLSGESVGALFKVLSSTSEATSELFLSLQCADGEWKVTAIEVRKGAASAQ
jgi:hypothetical protein